MKRLVSLYTLLLLSTLPVFAQSEELGTFVTDFGTISLTRHDLKNASLSGADDKFLVHLSFGEDVGKKLGVITELSVGTPLAFSLCGEVIINSVIREPNYSPTYLIFGLSSPQAKKVVELFEGKIDCSNW